MNPTHLRLAVLALGTLALAAPALAEGIDIRDHGAIVGGNKDCHAAFVAAAKAAGQQKTHVLVPRGTYRVSRDFRAEVPVRFEGVLRLDRGVRFQLRSEAQPPKISDYLKIHCEGSHDWRLDPPAQPARHTRALQAAIDDLLATKRARLDLEGRTLTLSGSVTFGANWAVERFVTDGTLRAAPGWRGSALIRIFDGGKRVRGLHFVNLALECERRAAGVWMADYLDIRLRSCAINRPKGYGIWTQAKQGGGLHVLGCKLVSDLGQGAVGIDLGHNSDDKVIGNRIVNFDVALRGRGSNHLIQGNHLWSSPATPGIGAERMQLGIDLDGCSNAVIVGNYIDGYMVRFVRQAGERSALGCASLIGNRFLVQGCSADAPVIRLENWGHDQDAELRDLIVRGNQFTADKVSRAAGGPFEPGARVARPFQAGPRIKKHEARNVVVADNAFRRQILPQVSDPELRIELRGRTRIALDLSAQLPFDLHVRGARAPGILARGNPGSCWVEKTGPRQVVLHLGNAVEGRATLSVLGSARALD